MFDVDHTVLQLAGAYYMREGTREADVRQETNLSPIAFWAPREPADRRPGGGAGVPGSHGATATPSRAALGGLALERPVATIRPIARRLEVDGAAVEAAQGAVPARGQPAVAAARQVADEDVWAGQRAAAALAPLRVVPLGDLVRGTPGPDQPHAVTVAPGNDESRPV